VNRFHIWPRSLGARTGLVVLIGLIMVQGLGLTIHAFDRIDLARIGQARDVAAHLANIYRTVAAADPTQRDRVMAEMELPRDYTAALATTPPTDDMNVTPPFLQRELRAHMATIPLPGVTRPHEMEFRGGYQWERLAVGIHMADGAWLDINAPLWPVRPWHSQTFLYAFLGMTAAAAVLILWAVRQMTKPVTALARAADALGRNVEAPPLPEDGPYEVATAARAFNTMASRIRRFVRDRTELLTAIGHDLRTPITRLKLRAEFVEDDELRRKMLNDLEEMEAMVAATLAFGREAATSELASPIDLAELLRTILDEAGDMMSQPGNALRYDGPPHMTVRARPLGLKRALANLVSNAVKYGGSAFLTLSAGGQQGVEAGFVRIEVDDDGPGIPPQELDRVFEPFHRLEPSRNRDTGGVGLGLPIARNILRAHGGDIVLSNRPGGGARATVLLPV
jgi:signal transduction histidine kinase